MQDIQSLAKTSNLVFRDDVSKGEQGLNVGPLFTRMDYFASEDANVSVKSLIMQRSSVNFRNTQVKLLSVHLI